MINEKFTKYTFAGQTGYIIAPWLPGATHNRVAVRHSANVHPWADETIHFHEDSEEYYFLRSGRLWLLVNNQTLTLEPNEFLQIRENVPHAIVKGEGVIEHFILRIPAVDDKQVIGILPERVPLLAKETKGSVQEKWGCRVSVDKRANRDCWLFGIGQARFYSPRICLAYMRYEDQDTANGYKDSYHHCYHAHIHSYEMYVVLKGSKTLRVEDHFITVKGGEILAVSPGTKHVFHEMKAPFEGFTLRTPLLEDKVEFAE